jgi:hypothetical protein
MIHAYAVFEHLELTLVDSLNECHRILKPNGALNLKIPLWDSEEAHDDPTHRWFVGRHALDLFDPTTDKGKKYGTIYGVKPWRVLHQGTFPGATCLYGRLEALK